ncbi:MAG: amino acid adenylation domain-containing protein, partial [Clostridia bacterium]|nr:amino acid adenylation domain-containing protein [Clostridia bacterium]
IADCIEKAGVSGGAVAICMPRSFEMIATMYGVLKAGCAYTFLKDSFPDARLHYMLEASQARLVIVGDGVTLSDGAVEGLDCSVVRIPEGVSVDARGESATDGVANILFTSGSTGRPKGVMLRHRSVANLYGQMKTLLEDVPGRVLCSTNCVFDCFIVETVIALALGRCVVMADDEEMMLPWKLAALVDRYETSVFEMTPTRLRMCLDNEDFRRAAHHIGIVLLGGEAVSRALVEDFCSCSDGRLMNMYGPTEATVFTTMCQLIPGEHVTIGRPLQNTRTYVLDENMRPVLPTACGEMYIAGECLAAGYASAPDQTAESFVDDIVFAGERMYKSGDIVRLRADGRYDYIGRVDEQIKLNGQRVELTEINGAITAIDTVLHGATVGVRREGFMSLCSFYVSGGDITPAEVTERLKKVLPPYMVPARMIRLEEMPMTATNKIDMMALRRMAESSEEIRSETAERAEVKLSAELVSAEAETAPVPEKNGKMPEVIDTDYVLSVWNRVLDEAVSDADVSFFDCGGSSMAALNVLGHYYNDKLEMSLSDFYENPTARAQAMKLGGGRPGTPPEGGSSGDKTDGDDDGEDHCGADAEVSAEAACVTDAADADEPEADDDGMVQGAISSDAYSEETGDILVTGATGFFGAHLTAYLVENDPRHVICLVRDGKGKRLRERFEWYFGHEKACELMDRVETVQGDVGEPYLGMTDEALLFLSSRIGAIYHCAADVRHYSPNEEGHLKVNVEGTREMLSLAKHSGAKFYHMSTCSVGGDELRDGGAAEFTESDFDIGQVWDKNVYVKSKFLAEKAVFEEMENGVDAKIFRLGRLVGRESDGKFQPNAYTNMFYLIIQSLAALGVVPEDAAGIPWDVMPVDMAAEQVAKLSLGDGAVFHIMNPEPPTLGEVFCSVDDSFRIVDAEEFARVYSERSSRMGMAKDALLKSYIMSVPAKGSGVAITCKETSAALEKIGYSRRIHSLKTVMSGFGKGK